MAPKPVCVLAVKSDFFPIEGTRRTVSRSKRLWSLFDRASSLELVEDRSTHMYTLPLARAAARFFARHLLGREVDVSTFQPAPFPESDLLCTKSGQVRAEFPDAEFVFDATAARLRQFEAERHQRPAADQKTRALGWLRDRVFAGRESGELSPRLVQSGKKTEDFEVDVAFWYSQPYLANVGMLFRPRERGPKLPVTIAIWDDGTRALAKHAAWLRQECAKGRAVFVVDLSGMGPLKAAPLNSGSETGYYGTLHKLADDLDWMGDSLVALRTYEALRAIDALNEWPDLQRDDVHFHGEGRAGLHARLAAVLDPRVTQQEWTDGFLFRDFVRSRNYDGADIRSVMLPGVLRYFDLDEL
jgi:hypothetical protein